MSDLFVQIKSKRPSKRDSFVVAKAAEHGLDKVLAWLRQGGDDVPPDEVDTVKRDLAKALAGWDLDGYKIAKDLDDDGWEPDAELVEILSDGWSWVSKAHDTAVSEWVRIHNPPLLPEGLPVAFKDGSRLVSGTIIRADHAHARYTINCPALGHGAAAGRIIDYENISPAVEEPAPAQA